MSGSMGRRQGETVRLALKSSDASGGVALVVANGNGLDRPIQKYERLIIDSLEVNVVAGVTVDITDPGANVSSDAILLGSFSPTAPGWGTAGEGISLSVGSTPLATSSGAGEVEIAGTGRVVADTGLRGFQAGYKALLTPGGTPGQLF